MTSAADNVQHLESCGDDNCQRCDYLLDGFYMFCDGCGHAGHQDSDGWIMVNGVPFCSENCAKKLGYEV